MTDEELQQTIKTLAESIDKLSDPDKHLTRKEKRRRHILLLEKETLQGITEAREKHDAIDERNLTITYGLLTSLGEKHPFLMQLAWSRFKWTIL